MKFKVAVNAVVDELFAAQAKFPPYNSLVEGKGVISEEWDELREAIRKNSTGPYGKADLQVEIEAKQVAATALRLLIDLC